MLVGRPEDVDPLRGDLDLIPASQVIGMDADPGSSVRTMKDSSLVRAAEAVRDGRASAMVSAGNTGATMASALLRMGRIKGVARPAIATPIPVPGSTPTVLLDAGANAECQPAWLVQFAQMGAVFARERYGIVEPRVGLLSIGEESTKGNPLVKETHALLTEDGALDRAGARFVGNVEGRDIMTADVDVVVTDGFTGNVALKTLEGGMKALVKAVLDALGTDRRGRPGVRVAPAPVRHARPRQHRRRHAARRRRSVHHQPRIVVGDGHGERHPGGPRDGRGRRGRPPARGRRPRLTDQLVHKRTNSGLATLPAVLVPSPAPHTEGAKSGKQPRCAVGGEAADDKTS